MLKRKQKRGLATSIFISLGTGVLSSFLTAGFMERYRQIRTPPLAPPGFLFPIVWSILYVLMGIAAYQVCENSSGEKRREALGTYGAQLFVNFLWPVLFFRFAWYLVAFFWLLLLWYLVFCTVRLFRAIRPSAGALLIPYLLWLTFAAYLNLYIALTA